jgi:hypothetical protein
MMKTSLALAATALAAALPIAASRAASDDDQAAAMHAPGPEAGAAVTSGLPVYDGDRLRAPPDYRQWIYLTTGIDMSYNRIDQPGHHMFDSVFVNPVAWRAFQRTGSWPDKTETVLETRGAATKGSINRRGYYQDTELMGVEVHVKDVARFGGDGWAFFSFDDTDKPAAMISRDNDCYSCHKAHAAVDSTFVQFYPTLLPIAKAKGTLATAYLQDLAQAPPAAP